MAPDFLLVEISPWGLHFRMANQHRYQRLLGQNLRRAAQARNIVFREALKHPDIQAIRRQTALPFEYRAARRYGAETGVPLVCVDSSAFSRHWIDTWPELVSVENLSVLLSIEAGALSYESLYESAARQIDHIAGDRFPAHGAKGDLRPDRRWEQRERFMADRILRALREHRPGSPAFIGGWWHLTPRTAPPTLRAMLEVPIDRCLLIHRSSPGEIVTGQTGRWP